MILVDNCSAYLSYFLAGDNMGYCHCLGVIPLSKHSRNNLANGLARSGAACFKTLIGIESGPFAFSMSSFCRIFFTFFG